MKNIVLTIFALSFTCSSFAQNPAFNWAGNYSGASGGTSEITDLIWMTPGIGGNTIACGYFSGSVDFNLQAGNATLTSNGGTDIFIARQNDDGAFIWALSIGGAGNDTAWTLHHGVDEMLYIGGSFSATVDFDPGAGTHMLTTSGSQSGFVLRIDLLSGNFSWADNVADGALTSSVKSIYTLADSTIGIAGEFTGIADLMPGPGSVTVSSAGATDAFVSVYNWNGTFTRGVSFQGGGTEHIYNLVGANDIFVVNGFFSDTLDTDPGAGTADLYAASSGSMFIIRIDTAGTFGISGQLNTDREVLMYAPDGMFLVVLAGTFRDSIDYTIDPSTQYLYSENPGTYDGFILSYGIYITSFNGQFTFGGDGDDIPTAIGGRYSEIAIGGTTGSMVFDADVTSDSFAIAGSGNDLFALAFAILSGDLLNAGLAADNNSDRTLNGIDLFHGGNGPELHFGGAFDASADFDPIGNYMLSASTRDAYQTRWDGCGDLYVSTSFLSCDSVFVFNNQVYSVPGTYTDTLQRVCGADSIINFSVAIFTHDTSVMANGLTLTANQVSSGYQWVDCNNNYTPIAGATQQSFSPLADGSYAVILSSAACNDTSSCHTVLGIGITEVGQNVISVSPNPFTASLEITNLKPGTLISVYNTIGELLITETAVDSRVMLATENLSGGVYYLITDYNGEKFAQKLVK